MPTIYAEGLFGTSLLNPSRRVPGFMREGGRGETDNERITPILLPLVPEFINIWISPLQFLHFVRSRRDWEKKCRIGIRHSPSTNRYSFAKTVAFYLCPFCIVMPTSGERGGEVSVEGKGVNWKCEMMMDDDEMNYFLHSLHNGILRARGWHSTNFWLYFLLLNFACSLHTLLRNRRILKTLHQNFALK